MTTLRKFPNRRLYCTHLSRYVTLREIRGRLLAGERVETRDGIDVTAEVLVMLPVEDTRAGRIPAEPLRHVLERYALPVRFPDGAAHDQKPG